MVKFDSPGNSWLNAVWRISLRTLELCMRETYEDCPFYEQLQYTMDTRLQILFTYALSHDASLPKKTIHDFHSSMLPEGIIQSRFPSCFTQVIPLFSLHWIFMLKDYYMETGDAEFLERYRPSMESILAWFKRKTGSSGLVEKLGYWEFADWTDSWSDIAGTPRAALHGPSAINNLVYACALETGASIMDALKLTQLSALYKEEKEKIMHIVNETCWSDVRNLYREGPKFEEYSQHAQVWAVLSGTAKGDKAKTIMRKALDDTTLIPCSFVMQYYLFRALENAGMYEDTAPLWDLWKSLLDLGLTTVPEIPGPDTRSDCHAWGALILNELPRKFLGVEPLLPGYEKISIAPMGLYLGEMSGEAPTPKGPVKVAWRSSDGQFEISGSTPAPSTVALPDGTRHDIGAGEFSFQCALKSPIIRIDSL
jgi:hypothetical protein